MNTDTTKTLQSLAKKYNTKDFIPADPISFPHRYLEKKDIEIAAFIAQWLAYGKRELFLRVLDSLGKEMGESPFLYIAQQKYISYKDDDTNLYRFYKKKDFYHLCSCLYDIYITKGKGEKSMEEIIRGNNLQSVLENLISLFPDVKGIPQNTKSACKRLCMFLRWMVRNDNIVDFGIWQIISPKDLIIPLDTHVFQQSKRLGLTTRNDASFKTAIEITENLRKVFPSDPTIADFALFGYGVNN
ncbi:MAG: TIGR02757 family protein [Bacteroidales bacterium]|nr:TIGR02757 family protein [Bacteroidales bacterium]